MRLIFVGLGAMGFHLAHHVSVACDSRHIRCHAYDIDRARAKKAHSEYGIQILDSLDSLRGTGAIVCLSLPTGSDVRVALGNKALRQATKGGVVFDFSSISPSEARNIAEDLEQLDIAYIDAPITGGVIGAQKGELVVIAGGSHAALDKYRWVPESVARSVVWAGPSGSGALLKSINNMIGNVAGLAAMEGLGILRRAGIPDEVILDVLNNGTGVTYFSMVRYPKYVMTKTFNAGMKLGLVNKDLQIALEAAADVGSYPVLSSLGRELWRAALTKFGPDADTTQMIDIVNQIAIGEPWQ